MTSASVPSYLQSAHEWTIKRFFLKALLFGCLIELCAQVTLIVASRDHTPSLLTVGIAYSDVVLGFFFIAATCFAWTKYREGIVVVFTYTMAGFLHGCLLTLIIFQQTTFVLQATLQEKREVIVVAFLYSVSCYCALKIAGRTWLDQPLLDKIEEEDERSIVDDMLNNDLEKPLLYIENV